MDNILQRRSQNSFKTNLTNMSTRRSKTVNGRVQGTGRFQCRFLPKIIHYSVQVRFYVCLPTHAWFYFKLICHYYMHQRREAGDPKYAKGPLIDGDHNDASLLARLKDKWRAYRKGNYSNIRLWGSVTIFLKMLNLWLFLSPNQL